MIPPNRVVLAREALEAYIERKCENWRKGDFTKLPNPTQREVIDALIDAVADASVSPTFLKERSGERSLKIPAKDALEATFKLCILHSTKYPFGPPSPNPGDKLHIVTVTAREDSKR